MQNTKFRYKIIYILAPGCMDICLLSVLSGVFRDIWDGPIHLLDEFYCVCVCVCVCVCACARARVCVCVCVCTLLNVISGQKDPLNLK